MKTVLVVLLSVFSFIAVSCAQSTAGTSESVSAAATTSDAAVTTPETAVAPEATATPEALTIPEPVTAPTETPAPVILTGTLIDNVCATSNLEKIAEFAKTHPKECAIKPECAASGYSLYADGVLYALDSESNAKVVEFLKSPASTLEVSVEGKLIDGKLSITSIKL